MLKTHFRWPIIAAVLCVLLSAAQAQQGDVITIREDSPDQYVVAEGDTLWDIAGVFLEEPWLWPEIWQVNPQIENPDLIYPSDTLVLNFVDGQPQVIVQRGDGPGVTSGTRIDDTDLPVVRLAPRVRREALLSPVPAISLDAMSAYLSNNRIVSTTALDDAPTVLASRADTQFSREGDVIFARGNWPEGISTFEIVRPAQEIVDPQSGEVIAMQTSLIGRATMLENNNGAATLVIDSNLQEVRIGDYFVVGETMTLASQYFPTPPDFQVDARILDINFGRTIGGRYDTVIVNLGAEDNIETGHLLSLQKPDNLVQDPTARSTVRPDAATARRDRPRTADPAEAENSSVLVFSGEIYGRILIYKVFEDHSFALVLSSDLPVSLEDKVITP